MKSCYVGLAGSSQSCTLSSALHPQPIGEGAGWENRICWGVIIRGCMRPPPPSARSGTRCRRVRGPTPELRQLNADHCEPRDKACNPGTERPRAQGGSTTLRPALGGFCCTGATGGAGGCCHVPASGGQEHLMSRPHIPYPHPSVLHPHPIGLHPHPNIVHLPPKCAPSSPCVSNGSRFLRCSL